MPLSFSDILRKIFLFFIDGLQTFLLAASFFLIIYIFLFRPFQVDGVSMFSTFHSGEYIMTSLISLKTEALQKGDVIVFKSPVDPNKDYIKRVIGLPGDTVLIQDGDVFVNGEKQDEHKYLDPGVRTYGGAYMKEGISITVPPDQYFVMGDNRPNSADSREWGPIKYSAIIGKSMFVYWPATRMRRITNPWDPKTPYVR